MLAALLVFLSALFAYRVWKSNMAGDWIGLGLAGICAAYCHNFALVSVVAVFILFAIGGVLGWICAKLLPLSPGDRTAAWLQVPYLLWTAFAGYLCWGVWRLN